MILEKKKFWQKYIWIKLKGKHAIVVATEKLVDVNKLAKKISEVSTYTGRATILGHIQRGGSPVPNDRLLATLMGDKCGAVVKRYFWPLCRNC